jgi:hypothetical protein
MSHCVVGCSYHSKGAVKRECALPVFHGVII